MPYRLLPKSTQDKLLKSNRKIPFLVFAMGLAITLFVTSMIHKAEVKTKDNEIVLESNKFSKNLNLVLLNSVLRLQALQEVIDDRRMQASDQAFIVKEIIHYSVFQEASIFRVEKARPGNSTPHLDHIRQYTANGPVKFNGHLSLTNLNLIRPKLKSIVESGVQSEFYLAHSQGGDTLNLIWHSHFRKNEYFLFSTPLQALLKDWPQNSKLVGVLSDRDSGLAFSILPSSSLATVDVPSVELQFPRHLKPLSRFPLISSNSNLELSWYMRNPSLFTVFSSIALALGLAISALFALLLRFVLDQNRRISEIVVSRTAELEIAMNQAREANLAKTRFLANISHELRSPLNLVLGLLDVLEEKTEDQRRLTLIHSMKTAGNHLLALITDLLTMSKEESTDISIKNIPINTPIFFEELGQVIGPECRAKGLQFFMTIASDVPAIMIGDPARLRQVLINLLRNGIRYSDQGHISLTVRAKIDRSRGNHGVLVKFEVEDTGVGIPEEKLSQIFERFFQVKKGNRDVDKGVGLGLAIVKDLVNKMKGDISVESEVNSGSLFTVQLPFTSPDDVHWISQYSVSREQSLKVLLVSTSISFRRSIEETLSAYNIEITPMDLRSLNKIQGENVSSFTHLIFDVNAIERIPSEVISSFTGHVIEVGRKLGSSSSPGNSVFHLEDNPILPSRLLLALGFKYTGSRNEVFDAQPEAKLTAEPLNIVVADDDAGNRELLRAYFEGLDWNIQFTNNGKEALEATKLNSPDVVIADLRMPIMDGFELTHQLRQFEAENQKRPIPIILVTADALEETARKAKEFNVDLMLTKPIRKAVLLEAIESVRPK